MITYIICEGKFILKDYGVLIKWRVGVVIEGDILTCDESHYYEPGFDWA